MKPTVTIDLEEYKTLKEIESAMMQKDFITYFLGLERETNIHIINAEESTRLMVAQINLLRIQLDKQNNKQWYQFWK